MPCRTFFKQILPNNIRRRNRQKNPIYLALLIALGSSSPIHADTIFGIYAGLESWNSSFGGDFGTLDETEIDVEETLGLDDESANSLYVAVEHPIPLLPNIKLRRTDITYSEDQQITAPIEFLGADLAIGELNSDIDLSHTDATLYYEILDNWVSLDLGLTVRQFDGGFRLESDVEQTDADLDDSMVLLYGSAKFELPFTGFYTRAEGAGFALEDHSHADFTVTLGYESTWRFGAELGYRSLTLDLDELNIGSHLLNSDLELSGLFLALTLHI